MQLRMQVPIRSARVLTYQLNQDAEYSYLHTRVPVPLLPDVHVQLYPGTRGTDGNICASYRYGTRVLGTDERAKFKNTIVTKFWYWVQCTRHPIGVHCFFVLDTMYAHTCCWI